MGQKEVENENYCGVHEMRDLERFFSEVLILPLKRNSHLIDYSHLMQAGKKHFDGHFLFENRVIWQTCI